MIENCHPSASQYFTFFQMLSLARTYTSEDRLSCDVAQIILARARQNKQNDLCELI